MRKLLLLLLLTIACEGPVGPLGGQGERGLDAPEGGVVIDTYYYMLNDTSGKNWIMEIPYVDITHEGDYFAEVWVREYKTDMWQKVVYGESYWQLDNYVVIWYNTTVIGWYCKIVVLTIGD